MRRLPLMFLLALLTATGTAAPKRKTDDASSSSARKGKDRSNPTLPANVFRDKIRDEAVDVLRDPPRLRLFGVNVTGNNRDIAEAVRTRLEALRDPEPRVPPYGVAYSVAVWDADVRPDFNEIVQIGGAILPTGRGVSFQSQDGITWDRRCTTSRPKNWPNHTLQFGWPCTGGAVVATVSAAPDAKNCLIVYLPLPTTGHVRLEAKETLLRIVKDECLKIMLAQGLSPIHSEGSAPSGPFPAAVNLTALSHCIYTESTSLERLRRVGWLQNRATGFRGVAVIPSYVAQGRDIGFSSPMGRVFFLDSGTSREPWPFGPLRELHLVYVAACSVLSY